VKVGFTCGCFDGLHQGHKHLLRDAARQCNHLIVAVNNDAWCRDHKGEGRPLVSLEARMEAVHVFLHFLPLGHAFDFAIIPFAGRDWELIPAIAPDVIFRGHDQSGACGAIPVVRVDKLEGFSTTLEAQRRSQ
jgi:D-beta-D-heptose 7-phosphate kinase / D-beta-D-heptose 1-phosphate adenosyltransferase